MSTGGVPVAAHPVLDPSDDALAELERTARRHGLAPVRSASVGWAWRRGRVGLAVDRHPWHGVRAVVESEAAGTERDAWTASFSSGTPLGVLAAALAAAVAVDLSVPTTERTPT